MTGRRHATVRTLVAVLVAAVCVASVEAQNPTADALVAKASAYVARFATRFSEIVTEERYVQSSNGSDGQRRELKSDYALIRLEGSSEFIEFRDVYEVDGRPVADRQARVLSFLAPRPGQVSGRDDFTWADRAREAAETSARFNLEGVGQLNRPLVAFAFVQAAWRTRFEFSIGGIDRRVGASARVLSFRERRPNNRSMYASGWVSGRLWVDEVSGAVLKTEVEWGVRPASHKVVSTFVHDPALDIHLPAALIDTHTLAKAGLVGIPSLAEAANYMRSIEGRATYGRFRQFSVATSEAADAPR
jgi:hypothetical protein